MDIQDIFTPDPPAVCWHEAGHAVVAWYLVRVAAGSSVQPFGEVQISGVQRAGHVSHPAKDVLPPAEYAAVILAGAYCEGLRQFGKAWGPASEDAWGFAADDSKLLRGLADPTLGRRGRDILRALPVELGDLLRIVAQRLHRVAGSSGVVRFEELEPLFLEWQEHNT